MDTLLDYLHWIGPFSFSEVPFGEVDQLVFSVFAYVRFELLGPGPVTLEEASAVIGSLDTDERKARTENDLGLLSAAAGTRRFRNVLLIRSMSRFDKSLETQFSATSFQIPDHFLVIAYRGTDSTITGWKEDFNMAFTETVPAQEEALSFLCGTMAEYPDEKAVVTGHSKGGNLSLYAYLKAPQAVKDRVQAVYSNDGPGFNDQSLLSGIDGKVSVYVPEESVVGMLLSHPEEYKVVRSSSFSLLQHDPHTWLLDGPAFAISEGLSRESRLFDRKLRDFLQAKSVEEREMFINNTYELIAAFHFDQARSDPSVLRDSLAGVMIRLIGLKSEDRKAMLRFLMGLAGTFLPESREELLFLLKQGV